MKLAKKVVIAATGVALCFTAVGAKAQAASVKFFNQSGNTYNFGIQFDSGEIVGAGSWWGLQVPSNTTSSVADTDSAIAKGFHGFASLFESKVDVDAPNAAKLNFSITSATNISNAAWFFEKKSASSSFNPGQTTGGSQAVPEPLTMGGTAIALGMGYWMKRKKAASQNA